MGLIDQTNERAFEIHVEETLLGASGWQRGANAEWDVGRALFPVQVCNFLEATQPRLWSDMRTLHGDGLETLLLASLVKELDLIGTLHGLRHGFKFYGKTFRLATFGPAHGVNDGVLSPYQKNRLTVTRQVLCHPGKHDTVDLVFALNGLPVATCELKNPGTGQSWRHAVRQYKKDRDPRAPLFRFKARALVHFAADPDEVHMATRPARAETHFLRFNRGSQPGGTECGAGNPQHPSSEEREQAFRDKLAGYVRVYAFVSQVVPYADSDLEMFYSYGDFCGRICRPIEMRRSYRWVMRWRSSTTVWNAYSPAPSRSRRVKPDTSRVRPRSVPEQPRTSRRRYRRSSTC